MPDRKTPNPGPEPTEPHRENVPGELDHASGEVEGFEAGLVSGAAGTPDDTTSDAELEQAATEVGDLDGDGDVDEEDRAIARRGGREPARTGGPRFLVFLRASWAELQRVQWPDRRQVGQATAVVVGFVIVAGAYLGFADWVAQKVVDVIL
ncbi:MAG: preprotein translocase subunit SecE [Baekduia sp.]|jgi:preprotein translocase SecE subunit|nr:secE [Conexibacter sp.]MDX6715418.1 preprotein translocase subunit SecE [Baekduia sp.]